ncbi:transmembrane protein 134-like [Styela clava]
MSADEKSTNGNALNGTLATNVEQDTIPISPTQTNGESTPLRGSKLVDKLVLPSDIASQLTQSRQRDSYSKFKNPNEVESASTQDVRIEFADGERVGSSWSLDTSNASSATTAVRWYQHPKVKEHWKVVVASFVLFFIGLGLCITGVILEAINADLSAIYIFFVIGAVCFIPGVYHLIAVYCAVKGKRGFRFYNLPLFN